jgi:CubicO group peptidase (beta-lactamase class C family)
VSTVATIDPGRLAKLMDRARRDVDDGFLPSCQIAVGYEGEIVAAETFGEARAADRYCIFSATKPFVASTAWTLIADGKLRVEDPVVEYFPEFAPHGKDGITVEQVMLHTSGFPHAPLGPPDWYERPRRIERMGSWKLNWQPGTRYEYHPTSAHWVLAEVIQRVAGRDFRDVVEERVTRPLGLPRILGLAREGQGGIRDLRLVGEHATADELEQVFAVRVLPETEVTDDAVMQFNLPEVRELGVPGGGGVARAVDLALFYQHLLHDPRGVWEKAARTDGTSRVRNSLADPMGVPANRSLGLLIAGDDGRSHIRGFGRTVSARAFGHNGAGGQLAWADPASGLSLGYLTDGYDRHEVRQPRRASAISSLAGALIA